MNSNIAFALAILLVSGLLTLSHASASVTLTGNSAFDAGQSIVFNAAISGGSGSYTVHLYNITAGSPLPDNTVISSGGSGTFTLTAGATGSFQFNAIASNLTNTFSSSQLSITVSNVLGTPLAPTATNSTLDIGQVQTLSVPTVSGGKAPVMYNFSISYVSNGVITRTSGPQASNVFTYTALAHLGTLHANVVATDSASLPERVVSAAFSFPFTQNSAPAATTLTPNSSSLFAGNTVTYNVLISGGTGPFTANLVASNGMVVGTRTGVSAGVVTFNAITPPAGSDSYNVVAMDTGTTSGYQFASALNTITVLSTTPLSFSSFCFSGSSCSGIKADIGQPLTLQATVTGGNPPYTYNFLVYNSVGALVAGALQSTSSTSNSFAFQVPSSAGTGAFTANLIVTDATPSTVNGNTVTMTVGTMPSVSLSSPSNSVLYNGGTEKYTATISGGTGPFNVQLDFANNKTAVSNTVYTGLSSGATVNMVFVPKLGSTSYFATATDTGTTSQFTYNTSSSAIKVVNTPTVSISSNITSANTTVLFTVTLPSGAGAGPFSVSIMKGSASLNTQSIPAGGGSFTYKYQSGSAGTFVFNATATDQGISPNYVFKSSGLGISFGSGSGSGSSTTTSITASSTTTTVSSSSTTTVRTTTTILIGAIIPVVGKNGTARFNFSSSTPKEINFSNGGALLFFYTNSSGTENAIVAVSNDTSGVPGLANFTELKAISFNVTSSANVTVNMTEKYPCTAASSSIKPFKLIKGAWTAITAFTIDSAACTITIAVPKDPTVGLFEAQSSSGGAIPLPPVQTTLDIGLVLGVVIVLVIIAIAGIIYLRSRRGRGAQGKQQQQ